MPTGAGVEQPSHTPSPTIRRRSETGALERQDKARIHRPFAWSSENEECSKKLGVSNSGPEAPT
jgi:hypothetical protein